MSDRPVKRKIINKVASKAWFKFRDDREYDKYRLISPTEAQRVHLKGTGPFTVQIKETVNWSTSRQATWRIKFTTVFEDKDKAVAYFISILDNPDIINMESIL